MKTLTTLFAALALATAAQAAVFTVSNSTFPAQYTTVAEGFSYP